MDSGDSSPPPSSSVDTMNLDPQSPAIHQPTVAVDPYATQAPSISSTGIRTIEPEQFPTSSQLTVAGESEDPAPSYSAFQHGDGNSITDFTGENGDRGLPQIDYSESAPNLDAVLHENNSATGFTGHSDYEPPPSYSGVKPINPSNPGASTADPTVNPQYDVGFSFVGRNAPPEFLMEPYNYNIGGMN